MRNQGRPVKAKGMSEEELLLSTAMPLVFSLQKFRLLPVSIKMN